MSCIFSTPATVYLRDGDSEFVNVFVDSWDYNTPIKVPYSNVPASVLASLNAGKYLEIVSAVVDLEAENPQDVIQSLGDAIPIPSDNDIMGNGQGEEVDIREWVSDRKRIHDAASKGPWRVGVEGSEGSRVNPDTGEKRVDSRAILMCNGRVQPEDGANALFVVDAYNIASPMYEMMDALLDLHQESEHGRCAVCVDYEYDRGEALSFPAKYPCETVIRLGSVMGL